MVVTVRLALIFQECTTPEGLLGIRTGEAYLAVGAVEAIGMPGLLECSHTVAVDELLAEVALRRERLPEVRLAVSLSVLFMSEASPYLGEEVASVVGFRTLGASQVLGVPALAQGSDGFVFDD